MTGCLAWCPIAMKTMMVLGDVSERLGSSAWLTRPARAHDAVQLLIDNHYEAVWGGKPRRQHSWMASHDLRSASLSKCMPQNQISAKEPYFRSTCSKSTLSNWTSSVRATGVATGEVLVSRYERKSRGPQWPPGSKGDRVCTVLQSTSA